MYKRGLKLWSVNTDFYYDEAIRLYQEDIYDYIELYVVPDTLDKLQKWKKLRIPFIIHNAHFAQGFNLARKEKESENRKIYEQTKQYADELNGEYIIFHGGSDGNIRETAIQLAMFNEPRALIENKPFAALIKIMGGSYCRGYNVDEIKLVMDTAGCGFCLDFGHAVCAANSLGEDIYEYCKNFLQLNPKMFHLTDLEDITSPCDSHLHLGNGQLDIYKILSMIPDNSKITFETDKNSKENLEDFKEDMKYIQDYTLLKYS